MVQLVALVHVELLVPMAVLVQKEAKVHKEMKEALDIWGRQVTVAAMATEEGKDVQDLVVSKEPKVVKVAWALWAIWVQLVHLAHKDLVGVLV